MDPFEMIQRVLRILFYVLVVFALVGFAAEKFFDAPNVYWMYCGVGAIGCSLIRFVLRFL